MKRLALMTALFLTLVPLAGANAHAGHDHDKSRPQDRAAIRKLVRGFSNAWGRHDASAMANAWTTDGDVINPAGSQARGRDEIRELLASEHGGDFRGTNLSVAIDSIQFIANDLAFVDATNVLKGLKIDKKKHPDFKHHFSFVAKHTAAGWKFLIARPYAFVGNIAPALGKHLCPKDGTCKTCEMMKQHDGMEHGKDFCPKDGCKDCMKHGK